VIGVAGMVGLSRLGLLVGAWACWVGGVDGEGMRLSTAAIINGNVVPLDVDRSFVVSLWKFAGAELDEEIESKEQLYFSCGATLIAHNWVLTAAHCVDDDRVLFVEVGDTTRASEDGAGDLFPVKRKILHPEFDADTFENDVALLELQGSASGVSLIIISDLQNHTQVLEAEGISVLVAGWGRTEEGQGSEELREASIDIIEDNYCARSSVYGVLFHAEMMICAGMSNGSKDSCTGDSGGPLFVANASGIAEQVGIVSFGAGCASPVYPGVYTRLSFFSDWIRANVPNIGEKGIEREEGGGDDDDGSIEFYKNPMVHIGAGVAGSIMFAISIFLLLRRARQRHLVEPEGLVPSSSPSLSRSISAQVEPAEPGDVEEVNGEFNRQEDDIK